MPAEIEACVTALASKAANPHALCNWMRAESKGYFSHAEAGPVLDAAITQAMQEYADSAAKNAKDGPKFAEVKNVEIFQAGEHREGKLYTATDLDAMAENFDRLKDLLRPPVVAGHEEDQSFLENSGYPSAGRVAKVWREGNTLKADFADVPQTIARLINGRAYNAVSAEVYDDFEHGGQHYGKALRRVALLGGQLPQIKTLADLPMADYSERPARTASLMMTKRVARPLAGTFMVFSEVRPMIPRPTRKQLKEKAAKFSDKAKATFAKFAAAPPTAPMAAPPTGVDRAAMLDMLGQMGFDTSTLTDATPDNVLAEIIRVYQGMMAADAAEPGEPPQPGTMNAEPPPIAPVPAQIPVAAPAPASAIPGVPGGAAPTQVTLKFGEKDVNLDQVLKPLIDQAVAAATKPINDKLSAAEQSVSKFQESEKKKSIDSRLDLLLKQGKVLPAEIDAGLKDQLYRADAIQKFSDGQTELDKQLAILEKRPVILKMSEQVKGGKGGTGNADDEAKKVQRFAEEDPNISRALQATGKTAADYLAGFAAAKAKNPALTAKQYGVPDAYLS